MISKPFRYVLVVILMLPLLFVMFGHLSAANATTLARINFESETTTALYASGWIQFSLDGFVYDAWHSLPDLPGLEASFDVALDNPDPLARTNYSSLHTPHIFSPPLHILMTETPAGLAAMFAPEPSSFEAYLIFVNPDLSTFLIDNNPSSDTPLSVMFGRISPEQDAMAVWRSAAVSYTVSEVPAAAPVPEPATALLLVSGLLIGKAFRKRFGHS